MKQPRFYWMLGIVLLVITVPYGLAYFMGGQNWVFTGFLFNPIDGAAYLAKMRQGWAGSWQFTLPFTAEPGSGTYLNLYYLLLGHLARWVGLPLILVFHLARVIGAGLLLLALGRFYDRVFAGRPDLFYTAFGLTVFGSGLGWLVVLTGGLPSDFLVAEAYPFLSMYANPHFPLGLALLVESFSLLIDGPANRWSPRLGLYGLLMAVVLPFALVVALTVAAVSLIWAWAETRTAGLRPLVSLGFLGGPWLLYQFWAALTHPVLAIWNAQNLTLSPALIDFLISFSPGLILAPIGIHAWLKLPVSPTRRLVISWLAAGLLLIYFPFSLQRRFMLGFYIPTTILAIFGIDFLCQRFKITFRRFSTGILALAYPTNVLVIVIGLVGAAGHSPALYLTQDEARAMAWIDTATLPQALILASPEMGRFIPAITGRRVIYGHPFETAYAAKEEQRVRRFFAETGRVNLRDDALIHPQVDFLLVGPREEALGGQLNYSDLPVMFEAGRVKIYAVLKVKP